MSKVKCERCSGQGIYEVGFIRRKCDFCNGNKLVDASDIKTQVIEHQETTKPDEILNAFRNTSTYQDTYNQTMEELKKENKIEGIVETIKKRGRPKRS